MTTAGPQAPDVAPAFFAAMRALATTVTIVTTAEGGHQAGLTATAVCSLSAEPPSLIACINRQTKAHDMIGRAGRFAVNLLADDQAEIARLFADRERSDRRFAVAPWHPGAGGMPILTGAAATFICRLERQIDAFTHSIFIGVVEEVVQYDRPSLLYGGGTYGGFTPV